LLIDDNSLRGRISCVIVSTRVKWLAKNTADRQTERISVANVLRFAFNGGICYLEEYLASS
jgi:hypothetical protein